MQSAKETKKGKEREKNEEKITIKMKMNDQVNYLIVFDLGTIRTTCIL